MLQVRRIGFGLEDSDPGPALPAEDVVFGFVQQRCYSRARSEPERPCDKGSPVSRSKAAWDDGRRTGRGWSRQDSRERGGIRRDARASRGSQLCLVVRNNCVGCSYQRTRESLECPATGIHPYNNVTQPCFNLLILKADGVFRNVNPQTLFSCAHKSPAVFCYCLQALAKLEELPSRWISANLVNLVGNYDLIYGKRGFRTWVLPARVLPPASRAVFRPVQPTQPTQPTTPPCIPSRACGILAEGKREVSTSPLFSQTPSQLSFRRIS